MDETPHFKNMHPKRAEEIRRLSAWLEIDHVNALLNADPTANKEYSVYLLSLYRGMGHAERMRLITEDLPKAHAYLWAAKELQRFQVSIKVKHGSKPKNLPDLYDTLKPELPKLAGHTVPEEVMDVIETGIYPERAAQRFSQATEDMLVKNKQVEIISNNEHYRLVKLKSPKASRFYGKGSQWCTLSSDTFNEYDQYASLFVLLPQTGDAKYQFNFYIEHAQAKDERDRSVSFAEISDRQAWPKDARQQLHKDLYEAAFADAKDKHYIPEFSALNANFHAAFGPDFEDSIPNRADKMLDLAEHIQTHGHPVSRQEMMPQILCYSHNYRDEHTPRLRKLIFALAGDEDENCRATFYRKVIEDALATRVINDEDYVTLTNVETEPDSPVSAELDMLQIRMENRRRRLAQVRNQPDSASHP